MLDDVVKELKAASDKSIEALRRDLSKVRTGRAHPSMLDGIRVDYYGTATPLAQMANILEFTTGNQYDNYAGAPGRVLAADFVNDVGSAPGTTDPLLRCGRSIARCRWKGR